MKKLIVLSLVQILIIAIAFGQEASNNKSDEELKTIFNKPHQNGGYGGFTIAYTKINEQNAMITGGKGGWIIDRSLVLGVAGYGFVTNFNVQDNSDENGLVGGYGGFMLEFIILPTSPVHLSTSLVFGGGTISRTVYPLYWPEPAIAATFFVFMPGIEMELNIVKFFRLSAGLNYTHTSEIILNNLAGDPVIPGNALNGFFFGLSFKFGKF